MDKKKISTALVILVAIALVMSAMSISAITLNDSPEEASEEKNIKNDPIASMKKSWGVRQAGKNYNNKVNGHATGLAPPTEEQYEKVENNYHKTADGVYTVGDTDPVVHDSETLNSESGEDLKAPASYDMTTEHYMPPIGDQGGAGACCAFSATYYSLTALMAQNYSYDVNTFDQEVGATGSNPTHANKIMSPAWSYNMVNSGEDSGTNWFGLWDLSNTVGNPAWAYQEYDENDVTSWGNETAWRNAPNYRTTSYTWLNTTESSTPIETLKTWISEGYPLGIGIDANAYPTNQMGMWSGDEVVSSEDWGEEEALNHANTLIGYDDSMEDTDGSGETGAFLVANSWGASWGPYSGTGNYEGCYWMTYDCLMNLLFDNIYKVNDAMYGPSNEPEMLSTVTFSQEGDRDPGLYWGIAEEDGGPEPNDHVNDTRKPMWDGASATKNPYPSFIAMDITEFYSDWDGGNGANYFDFHLDESGGTTSTMDSFYVEDWGSGYQTNPSATPDRKSINSPDSGSSNPTTMWTTFSFSDGSVDWNQTKYAADDTATVRVVDGDLEGDASTTVTLESDSGDSETFTLDEDNKYPHIFRNTAIPISSGGVTTEDGTLQVSGGDTITATYADASHGDKTHTATIDEDPPVISGITATPKLGAVIEWTTDEPSDSRVNYGKTTSYDKTVYDSSDVTEHRIEIDQLNVSTTYHFEIVSENEAGYTTTSSDQTFSSSDFDDVEAGWVNWTQTPQGVNSNSRWQVWSDEAQDSQSYNIGNGNYGNKWSDNLTSPIVDTSGWSSGEFEFWHEYTIENGWDGGVVDIRTDGGSWERINADEWDTSTSGGGYDAVIEDNEQSSIGDGTSEAFTGSSDGWVRDRLDISSYLPADTVQLKFWFCTDGYEVDVGWNIDNVTLTTTGGVNPPSIDITSPDGGESWDYNTDQDITWDTTGGDGSITGVDLQYSADGGSTWNDIVTGTADDGSYTWTVPNEDSSTCLVKGRVNADDGTSATDESADYFTIVGSEPPTMSITQPNGGEEWDSRTTYDITWTSSKGDGSITGVDLEYSTDAGASWNGIVSGTADNGVYSWETPYEPSTECLVRGTIHDDLDGSSSDQSNDYFTIKDLDPIEMTITDPNGGESLEGGSTFDISWQVDWGHYNINHQIDLAYSTHNDTENYTDIATDLADDSPYTWTVPTGIDSDQCFIRGYASGANGSVNTYDNDEDWSDSPFEIYDQPESPTLADPVEHWGYTSIPVNDTASSATVNEGTTAGTYTDTQTQDDVYHEITEDKVQGRPSLEVVYSVPISGTSGPYTLYIDAHFPTTDTENCPVEYSVDGGASWTSFDTITAETDTDTYISGELSGVSSGSTVDVRITDDLNSNREAEDTLYVDHIYINSATEEYGGTSDNAVNWTASPDDGAGDNDVAQYNIYRADNETGPWSSSNVIGTVTADGSSDYSYMDTDKGTADNTYWYYVVRAVDDYGNNDTNTISVQEEGAGSSTYDVHDLGTLTAGGDSGGWNFVSFNLDANGDNYAQANDLVEILDDTEYGISGNYDKAMYYDATNDEWRSYMPDRAEAYNDLETWDNTMGVWIRMTVEDTLQVEGTAPTSTDVQLEAGWNMVSYPSDTTTASDTELPTEVSNIGYFDAAAEYNIAYTEPTSTFDLEPGEGYWLYCDAPTTWTVDY